MINIIYTIRAFFFCIFFKYRLKIVIDIRISIDFYLNPDFFIDPPSVIPFTQKDTIEGQDFLIICRATPGNPITTMFWSIKVNDPVFKQNGSILQLPNIQRNSSGTYKCTAENTYSNREKGTNSRDMVIDVLCNLNIMQLLLDNKFPLSFRQ